MDLFTRNIPYYHLLKYLLFLLKHPVYYTPRGAQWYHQRCNADRNIDNSSLPHNDSYHLAYPSSSYFSCTMRDHVHYIRKILIKMCGRHLKECIGKWTRFVVSLLQVSSPKPLHSFSPPHVPHVPPKIKIKKLLINPLNPELNPICYLLALLGAHHFLHVSRIRVKLLTLRLLMSYIYIWSTHSWCF